MIDLVPFRAEHAAAITDAANEPGLLEALGLTPADWAALEACGTTFSGFEGGRFVGCGGYTPRWRGVAEVWLWALPAVQAHPLRLHRLILSALRYLQREKGFRRISCDVRVGNDRAVRWVEMLGFVREGVQRGYGPDGSDFYLYGRVT